MNRWRFLAAVAVPVLLLTGCEFPGTEEDSDDEVTFVNSSTHHITVIPQSQGWSGFSFAPGERHRVSDTSDIFFTYEPRFRVTVGENTGGRILFVNLRENTVQAETGAN